MIGIGRYAVSVMTALDPTALDDELGPSHDFPSRLTDVPDGAHSGLGGRCSHTKTFGARRQDIAV